MRHSVILEGNKSLKNQLLQGRKISNIKNQSILKLQQNSHFIYCIYNQTDDTPHLNLQKSQISYTYLLLNNFNQGHASVTQISRPIKIKSVQIELSQIDYQVVNNNFHLLQRSFLEQVNIVWPKAKIPLFYDDSHYITLNPIVNKVSAIDPYAAISFSIQQNQSKKKNELNQKNQQQQEEEQQFNQKMLILKNLQQKNRNSFGYENKLIIGQEQFKYIKRFKKNKDIQSLFCTVLPALPFVRAPAFEEYMEYKRLQASSKLPEIKPILIQLLPQENDDFSQQQRQTSSTEQIDQKIKQTEQIAFECSQLCKQILKISEKLMLTEQSFQQPLNFQTISIQMFLKQLSIKKYKISIKNINPNQDAQSNSHNYNLQQKQNKIKIKNSIKIKKTFSQRLIQHIIKCKQFLFLQDYYPFIIDNEIYSVLIEKKQIKNQKYTPLKNFLIIKNCSSSFITLPNLLNYSQQSYSQQQNASQQQNQSQLSQVLQSIQKNIFVLTQIGNDKLPGWFPYIKFLTEKQPLNHSNEQFKTLFKSCYEEQLHQCQLFIQSQLTNSKKSSNLLFTTFSSNGKTYLHTFLNSLQNQNQNHIYRSWYIDFRSLNQSSNTFQQLKQYLQIFITICPYRLIFFDNVDTFLPNIDQGDQMKKKQKIIASVFAKLLINLLQFNNKIGIFTSKTESNLDKSIKFNKVIKLKNPNRIKRTKIIQLLQTFQNQELNKEFIDKTQSLSLGQLAFYILNKNIPSKKISKKKNDFSRIVGLEQAKKVIKSVIQKPNKYGFIYQKVKIKVPRGILLFGATGNGKTALGSSVEDEFNMKFFTIKGSDILSKYIGGSQAAVRQIFQKALSVAPSIIFFDQFQSIVPRRNSSGTGVTDRVVNQFLCYLDGVSSTTGVFIIAASSRPDLIDPALLRPGRIDSHIYLDYPNQNQRASLIKMFQNSVRIDLEEQQIVKQTQNFSYSDLIGLLKQLRIKKSSLLLKEKSNPTIEQFKMISAQLFKQTIDSYRIGTELTEQKKQKQLFEKFKSGKGPQVKKQKFIQM